MLADDGMGRARDARGRLPRGQAINPAALREARRAAALTLMQTASGICTKQALSQMEGGVIRPMPDTLQALAARLGVPVDALLRKPHDPRERTMRDLEERQQWRDLEQLASEVIADVNVPPRTQAVARFYLGRAILDADPAEAVEVLRRARGHLAQLGEPWLSVECRDWEAVGLYYLQDPSALDAGRQALARYRSLADRDPAVEARMLEHVGTFLLQRQEVGEALASYRQAIDVAGSVLNFARLANVYHGLASGCFRIGETREAIEYFERAVHLARILADVRGVGPHLARLENDFAHALLQLGRWERAEEMIGAALEHFQVAGVEAARTHAMLTMGEVQRGRGRTDEAVRWTGEAIDLAERLGERVSLAGGYQQMGELAAEQGQLDRFEACFARALEILDQAGLRERRAEALRRYKRVRDDRAQELASS